MKVEHPAILLVEDDPNDQLLIKRTFKSLGVVTPICVVNDGQQALDYLNGKGEYSDRARFPFPTAIITDLKMPVMDGFSVLEHLKANLHWAIIPIVVLSASSDVDDIRKSYMLGASAFHTKPSDSSGLRELLKCFTDYWGLVEVPQSSSAGKVIETDSCGKLGERYLQEK
ncbi:MAG: response regulator [Limisphaerales bacterium]